MNRRNFSKSMLSALGVTMLPATAVVAGKLDSMSKKEILSSDSVIHTEEGLQLKLIKHEHGTASKDDKQFILTYEVINVNPRLEDKIYHLKMIDGHVEPVHLSPVADNLLQAVFNWRLNA